MKKLMIATAVAAGFFGFSSMYAGIAFTNAAAGWTVRVNNGAVPSTLSSPCTITLTKANGEGLFTTSVPVTPAMITANKPITLSVDGSNNAILRNSTGNQLASVVPIASVLLTNSSRFTMNVNDAQIASGDFFVKMAYFTHSWGSAITSANIMAGKNLSIVATDSSVDLKDSSNKILQSVSWN